MDYLFDESMHIKRALEKADHCILVADYDGTLTPLGDDPTPVRLTKETKEAIANLGALPFFTIGIISGRSLTDLKRRINIGSICYCGNNGLEIEGPHMKYTSPGAKNFSSLIAILKGRLTAKLEKYQGVLIEDKDLTISIHYRKAQRSEVNEIEQTVTIALAHLMTRGKITIEKGMDVLEVRPPVDFDKGNTMLWMIRNVTFKHNDILPVYIGDDEEDESGFETVNARNGISIYVGNGHKKSCAHYFLKSQQEVIKFLRTVFDDVRRTKRTVNI